MTQEELKNLAMAILEIKDRMILNHRTLDTLNTLHGLNESYFKLHAKLTIEALYENLNHDIQALDVIASTLLKGTE